MDDGRWTMDDGLQIAPDLPLSSIVYRPSSIVSSWRRATACLLLLLITVSCDFPVIPTRPPATPGAPGASPTPLIATPKPTPTLLPQSERSEIFASVCQTVKDHYLHNDFYTAHWRA